jgi:hypothetical protein
MKLAVDGGTETTSMGETGMLEKPHYSSVLLPRIEPCLFCQMLFEGHASRATVSSRHPQTVRSCDVVFDALMKKNIGDKIVVAHAGIATTTPFAGCEPCCTPSDDPLGQAQGQ